VRSNGRLIAAVERDPGSLVIHGDHDLIPLECVRNIAVAMFGSRLVVLSDCWHFAYLESPIEFLIAIVHFFAHC
jgi:pimeloyl-ACP methyl ester carboxylesterase